MIRLLSAFILACVACALAPDTRADAGIDASPWPLPIVRTAMLGRPYAAADLTWLKTVQIIGDDEQTRRRWPTLHLWIDLATRLDARFEEPYYLGATLLVTESEHAEAVDTTLARGEAAYPDTFTLPMLRGFLAQFGALDGAAALRHYERASQLPGAPALLPALIQHLREEASDDCRNVVTDLSAFAAQATSAQSQTLAHERGRILEHCLKGLIFRTAYQLRNQRPDQVITIADVEQRIQERTGQPLPHPPGLCWQLVADKGKLAPCSEAAP